MTIDFRRCPSTLLPIILLNNTVFASGIHHLPGPKVDVQHQHHQKKKRLRKGSGGAAPVSHCNDSVYSLHIHHYLVWISHQTGQEMTTTDNHYCRENHWCQPALHPGLIHFRVKSQAGNMAAQPVPTSPLWRALQNTMQQNNQTQEPLID